MERGDSLSSPLPSGERIKVRGRPSTMKISKALLAQIHAHLEAGYPNEACGVMLGRSGAITEVVSTDNTRSDSARNRYLIDPLAYMKIERDADKRGLQVLGIYHSHPDVAARPSQFDLDHAWPNLSYLIVSVVKGKVVESNSWLLREDRSQFDQEALEISG
jgi:proteasome lid subunit RPN8/RPN11